MDKLDVIIFPVAKRADFVASRRLTEHEESTTRTRIEIVRHERSNG
jgi:hypothetical protein